MKYHIPILFTLLLLMSHGTAFCQEFHSGTFRIGIEAGLNIAGDEFTHTFSDYKFHPSGGLAGEYMVTDDIGVEITLRAAEFSKDLTQLDIDLNTVIINQFRYNSQYIAGLAGVYYPIGNIGSFTPIIGGRAGLLLSKASSASTLGKKSGTWESAFAYGIITSIDYSVNKSLSLRLDFCPLLTTSDNLDGLILGDKNDGVSIFSIGVYWNIFERTRDPEWPELAEIPRSPVADRGSLKPEAVVTPQDSPVSPGRRTDNADADTAPTPDRSGSPSATDEPVRPVSTAPQRDSGAEIPVGSGMPPGSVAATPTVGGPSITNAKPPAAPVSADCIATMLRVSDFASLGDLRVNPRNLSLYVEQAKEGSRSFNVQFELLGSGTVIASSMKHMTVAEKTNWFDANQFIDFNRLDTQLNLTDPLPMGEYSAAVTLIPERSNNPVGNEIRFHHVDIESVFGKEAANVRYLISTGKATGSVENPREIQLNVFGNQRRAANGPRISSCDAPETLSSIRAEYNRSMNAVAAARGSTHPGSSASANATPAEALTPTGVTADPGQDASTPGAVDTSPQETVADSPWSPGAEPQGAPVIIREPASAVPESVPEADRNNYLNDAVRSSISKALSMTSWMKSGTQTDEKVVIVLAEVYFGFDAAELTEESKVVLDFLARDLIKHPEFVMEIRGYSDELGDSSYNQLLSQRRADRVVEYLGRRQVSEIRIRARGFGSRSSSMVSSPSQQQFNRKAQIVLVTGN